MTLTVVAQEIPSRPAGGASVASDTGSALTPDMRELDAWLVARTRDPLERWGHTFYALAAIVFDTGGPPEVSEIGMTSGMPEPRIPAVFADSLRSALRGTNALEARTVGVIVDSIAGRFEDAVDGIEGPPFPRFAIAELEDRSGRCRRVERAYRFVAETGTGWGFGRIAYSEPHVTRCEPRMYWPTVDTTPIPEDPPRPPRLLRPIVRPIAISSLDHNYFGTVGRFTGKMTVFDDSIVVLLDTVFVTRRDKGASPPMRLDSVTVSVGVGAPDSWSTTDESNALRLRQPWPVGAKVERRRVRLVLPHRRVIEDPENWLVVTMHQTNVVPDESGYTGPSTTYAHSEYGVLAPEQ